MRTTLIIIAVLVAGCAQPQYVTTYYKTSATRADYDRDVYDCNKDAAPTRDVIRARDLINQCMTSKGYTPRLERM